MTAALSWLTFGNGVYITANRRYMRTFVHESVQRCSRNTDDRPGTVLLPVNVSGFLATLYSTGSETVQNTHASNT